MFPTLVCGLAVVDLVFDVHAFPDSPRKFRARNARIAAGGCAGVAAAAILRLGGKARIAARVGDDEIGSLTVRQLQSAGIDTSLVVRSEGGRSPFSSVYVDGSGERQIMAFHGSGLAQGLDGADLGNVGAILADTRWPAASAVVLEHARKLGVPGVLDGEAPIPDHLAALASHVAFSSQGLASYTGSASVPEAMDFAQRRIDGWICTTDGARGTFYFEGNSLRQILPPRVDAVDTLGAGDVWHGAFTLRLAEGATEKMAVRFANAAAAHYCTRAGRRDGGPTRRQVEALCASAYG